ncbi:MAG: flagellar hook-length control protein, partial [Pseudomonadota bacterium]
MRTSGLALALSMMALTGAHAQPLSEPAATAQPLVAPTQATEKSAETPMDAMTDPPILLEPAEPAPMRPVGAAVQVTALSAPDIFSPGARNTGLSADLWKGSAADMAREILPQIGKKPLSPAAAALARR